VNCPNVSNALSDIADAFPDNFIYLKYHTANDSLALYDNFLLERTYYDLPTVQPITIFQGQTIILGGTQANIERYPQIVSDLLSQEAEITLEILESSVTGRSVSGIVALNFYALDTTNLYLYVVVYEKETTAPYIFQPALNAKNVVRGRHSQPLTNIVSGQRVNFTLETQRHLAHDTYIVVWVQRIADINRFSPTDRILNATYQRLFKELSDDN
jgi:hypothetical protein